MHRRRTGHPLRLYPYKFIGRGGPFTALRLVWGIYIIKNALPNE